MVEYKNYDEITMSRNYYRKLSQEIMTSISMTQKMWELQVYWRIQKFRHFNSISNTSIALSTVNRMNKNKIRSCVKAITV